jgi:hypothetical protein
MATLVLEVDFWSHRVIVDALREYRSTWIDKIRDAEETNDEMMCLEGANLIVGDINKLIDQVCEQPVRVDTL